MNTSPAYLIEAHRNGQVVFARVAETLREMFDAVKRAALLSGACVVVTAPGRTLTADEEWAVNHAITAAWS